MKQKTSKKVKQILTLEKSNSNYNCEICCFTSLKKANLESHFLTKKHLKKAENETRKTSNETQKKAPSLHYVCDGCNCNFNSRTTLWRHCKKCMKSDEIEQIPGILFCCEKCDLTFNSKLHLLRHKKNAVEKSLKI